MTEYTCQAIVGDFDERCGKVLEQLVRVGNLEDVPLCPEHAENARDCYTPRMRGRPRGEA